MKLYRICEIKRNRFLFKQFRIPHSEFRIPPYTQPSVLSAKMKLYRICEIRVNRFLYKQFRIPHSEFRIE